MYAVRRVREALKVGDEPLAIRVLEHQPRDRKPPRLLKLLEMNRKGRLKPEALMRLLEILENSFSTDELKELLSTRVGKAPKEFPNTFEMLLRANFEGWIDSLVSALLDALPSNPEVYAVAQDLDLTALSKTTLAQAQEVTRSEKSAFLDVNLWRERLGEIERCVCRVEWNQALATGFLVGRGTMLFPAHALPPQVKADENLKGLKFRFDFRESRQSNLGEAPVFFPAKNGLLDRDDGLDYALVRVEGDISSRGWLKPIVEDIKAGSTLILLQHNRGGPLKLSFETKAVVRLDRKEQRLVYHAQTEPGSGGAPCLDENLNLVAMHLAATADGTRYGVPLFLIRRLLEKRGISVPGWDDRRAK